MPNNNSDLQYVLEIRSETAICPKNQTYKDMITKDEIRALLNDLENDRVERTISTTNTDKFGQAICTFANDLSNQQLSGYLFLGVRDNGEVQGLNVTDELLKNVAAIRTNGNIQVSAWRTYDV